MASPEVAALRAVLEANKAALLPEIRGTEDWLNVSLSDAAKSYLREELGQDQRRLHVIDQALIALDNLDTDGFPDTPLHEVPPEVQLEMDGQMADFQAAFRQFGATPPASNIAVNLGTAVTNPATPSP